MPRPDRDVEGERGRDTLVESETSTCAWAWAGEIAVAQLTERDVRIGRGRERAENWAIIEEAEAKGKQRAHGANRPTLGHTDCYCLLLQLLLQCCYTVSQLSSDSTRQKIGCRSPLALVVARVCPPTPLGRVCRWDVSLRGPSVGMHMRATPGICHSNRSIEIVRERERERLGGQAPPSQRRERVRHSLHATK